MSGISTTISLIDKFTPVLKNVSSSVDTVSRKISNFGASVEQVSSAFNANLSLGVNSINALKNNLGDLIDQVKWLKSLMNVGLVNGGDIEKVRQLIAEFEKLESSQINIGANISELTQLLSNLIAKCKDGVSDAKTIVDNIKLATDKWEQSQNAVNRELTETASKTYEIINGHSRTVRNLDLINQKYKSQLNTIKMIVDKNVAANNGNNKEIAILNRTLRLVNEKKKKHENIVAICGRSNDEIRNQNNKLREQVRILNQRNHVAQRFKPTSPKVIGTPPMFGSSKSDGGNVANDVMGAVKNLAGAYLGVEAVGSLVRTSDELTNITARIAMVNDRYNQLNGTQLKSAKLQEMIYEAANRSRASFFDTAQVVSRIGMNAGGAFKNSEELVGFAELLQKSFIVAGTNAEEMRSAMLQLSQGMASNRLQGDELRSIFESAPIIANYIADYLGVSLGQVRELASEGKITAEVIKNAFFKSANDIDKKFAKMPKTFTQIWQIFKNKALEAWQPLYAALRNFANSDNFDTFFSAILTGINLLATVGIKAVNLISGAVTQLRENMWWIKPILGGVAAMFIALGVASLWAKAQMIQQGISAMWASLQYQVALFKMSVAQHGLNATIAMCPISWFIGAIIAFIVIIYLAVAAVNKFAGTNISATGLIVGAFVWLGSMIANVFIYLGNLFLIFADFVRNFLKNPVYTIQKLFSDLFINILDFTISAIDGWDKFCTDLVNLFKGAFNWVLEKWNTLADTTVGKKLGLEKKELIQNSVSVVGELKGMRDKFAANMQAKKPDDYKESTKINYLDAAKNAKAAYLGTRDKVSEFTGNLDILKQLGDESAIEKYKNALGFDNLTDLAKYLTDAENERNRHGLGDGLDSKSTPYKGVLDAIAANTASTADDLAEIEWMRSLGSREATNRFTTKEIKLTMNNTNNISKDADSNTFIGLLVEEFKRAMATSAEGA